MNTRQWYNEFEARVINPFFETCQGNNLDDRAIRATFLQHAQEILKHYNKKEAGFSSIYLDCAKSLNNTLNVVLDNNNRFPLGRLKLLFPSGNKLLRSEILRISQLISWEVNSAAERDLVLLAKSYIDFFILSDRFKGTFESSIFNKIFNYFKTKLKSVLTKENQDIMDSYLKSYEASAKLSPSSTVALIKKGVSPCSASDSKTSVVDHALKTPTINEPSLSVDEEITPSVVFHA